jgi:hypothetical protein
MHAAQHSGGGGGDQQGLIPAPLVFTGLCERMRCLGKALWYPAWLAADSVAACP